MTKQENHEKDNSGKSLKVQLRDGWAAVAEKNTIQENHKKYDKTGKS